MKKNQNGNLEESPVDVYLFPLPSMIIFRVFSVCLNYSGVFFCLFESLLTVLKNVYGGNWRMNIFNFRGVARRLSK